MAYRVLAEIILVLHFCFVVFVVFGGLLVVRRRYFIWLHLPAIIWGAAVEFFRLTCPLTTLENTFRELGGEAGYADGFLDYYISAVLYAHITPQIQIMLGILLIIFNLLIYGFVFRKRLFAQYQMS